MNHFQNKKSTSAFKVFALPFSMSFSHVTFSLMGECAGRGGRHPGASQANGENSVWCGLYI